MKEIQTRSQRELGLALRLIDMVARKYDKDHTTRQVYGRLCHAFPALVRTCGLCQAVGFSMDKAAEAEAEGVSEETRNRARAHRILLAHIATVLANPSKEQIDTLSQKSLDEYLQQVQPPDQLLESILNADLDSYILYTRRILSSWVYFKRFARSILKVEPGGDSA